MTNTEKYVDLHKKWVKANDDHQPVQACIFDQEMKEVYKTLNYTEKNRAWKLITALYPKEEGK